jgi:hypothetical protein
MCGDADTYCYSIDDAYCYVNANGDDFTNSYTDCDINGADRDSNVRSNVDHSFCR